MIGILKVPQIYLLGLYWHSDQIEWLYSIYVYVIGLNILEICDKKKPTAFSQLSIQSWKRMLSLNLIIYFFVILIKYYFPLKDGKKEYCSTVKGRGSYGQKCVDSCSRKGYDYFWCKAGNLKNLVS